MKKTIFIFLLTLFTAAAFAQQNIDPKAKAVLDKAVQELQRTSGVTADFQITMAAGQTDQKQIVKGSLWLKGNKFKLVVPGVETYFDGTTQWVYMSDAKEVTISNPTAEELREINPTALLASYKKGYKIEFDAGNSSSTANYDINLYPTDLKKDFFRINIKLDKNNYNLLSIKTYDKSGASTDIVLAKYQSNVPLDDSMFVFQTKDGVDEIDLR